MKPSYQDALAYYGISGAHPGGLFVTKQLLNEESITPQTQILDAGCGTGQTSAYLAQNFPCSITSTDQHPIMIKRAKQRFQQENLPITLVQANIEKLPFPNETFDLVLVESVLIFTNYKLALSEIHRVLKKDGVLLLLEMTAERPLTSEEHTNITTVYGISDVLTEEAWLNILAKTGFRDIEIKLSHSVLSHLFQHIDMEDEPIDASVPPSMHMDQKLMEHSHIVTFYSSLIGYRAFRMQKS